MTIHYADPPILLRNVISDLDAVVGLLERNAPYTPLGGWYSNGVEDESPSKPMWFQADWVHADLAVEGSDLFLHHPRVIETAKAFYDAEIIEPKSIYVNLMVAMDRAGPAHTDNPRFHGRDRTNTPMWLLRSMLWSGLFDRYAITQATSIWWLNDVEGGALLYWADGPDEPPHRHEQAMANTALVGDNHGMFHQVGPVGPYGLPNEDAQGTGTPRVTSRAELAPVADGTGDWAIRDRGSIRFRGPLESYRVSVLWKADVYRNAEERRRQQAERLSFADVARIFDEDLQTRGTGFRFDLERIDAPEFQKELAAIYPEARPTGALPSVYDD